MADMTPKDVIEYIAEVAIAVAWQSGTGALETAGLIVSVLANRPEEIDRFMSGGSEFFIDGTMQAANGCLTFYSANGSVTTPEYLRAAIAARKILTDAGAKPRPASDDGGA